VHAGKIASGNFYAALPQGYYYETRIAPALDEDDWAEFDAEFVLADQPITAPDIRAAMGRLNDLADGAAIPDEHWKFDISDEFKAAVDKALAVVEP
jgi:hypothetical protein